MNRTKLIPLACVTGVVLAATTAWAAPATAVPAGPAPGTVLIADAGNHRIIAVAPDGTQSTVLGTGLRNPFGVAADGAGNVFIADTNHDRVLKVAPDGTQSTVLDTGLNFPTEVAADAGGDVFIADAFNNRVLEVAQDGTQSIVLDTGLSAPTGVALDAAGDVLIADQVHNRVVKVAQDGTQSTVLDTGLNSPVGVGADAAGDVLIADTNNHRVLKVAPDGTQTNIATGLQTPQGVTADPAGDVLIADAGSGQVFKVAPDGTQSPVGTFSAPVGVAVVPPRSQIIHYTSTAPTHARIGDTYTVTATGGDSGNPVTFTRNAASAGQCTVTNDGENSATVTFTGHGYCAIFAHQAGNEDYAPATAPARQRILVYKKTQTISFTSTPPEHPGVGGAYPVSATGGDSGEAVTFTSNTAATCTVSNDGENSATVAFTGRGTCNVDAHQAGTDTYAAAKKVRQHMHVYLAG